MKKGSTIPDAILSQLDEHSTGYLLISINDKGGFDVNLNSGKALVVHSGLLNFAAMQIECMLENLHREVAEHNQSGPPEGLDGGIED